MQVVVVFLYNQSSLFIGQALGVVEQRVVMHGSQSHGQTSLSLNKVRGNRQSCFFYVRVDWFHGDIKKQNGKKRKKEAKFCLYYLNFNLELIAF